MNEAWRDRLEAAGLDTAQALERMMGSEALLERLLDKFLEDGNFAALTAALRAGDAAGAVQAAHTLKGVCGNLSMTELYRLFTGQVEALRGGELDGGSGLAAIRPGVDGRRHAARFRRRRGAVY